ncbi:MAG: nucleotidyl transferase AbiEii/AbiGii toxin family protein [Desulfurispora sp.]|uniref:nucleotidyl transferase AbiEii/AbiGii toxin family protein n=1 Tax=Desulfurispora sp. TaxID=3014275 RepID=UPI00404AFC19
MFTAALPPGRGKVLEQLARLPALQNFYLAGGTAVALHLGHRISEDLDFFTGREFDPLELRHQLHKCGEFAVTNMQRGTLHGLFHGVKVSFLYYEPPLLFPPDRFAGCPIAALPDLAPIKLDTVGSRGSKKDFIDLYFISLYSIPLMQVFSLYRKKYAHLQINLKHLLMSLTYFEDAEKSREQIILLRQDVSWPEIKRYFEQQARNILDELKKTYGE